jgi:organic hydroperoxide reductase OsmC/OhrA
MSEHQATVRWQRTNDDFTRGRYSREHRWEFDGGLVVPASPAPSSVPAPWSNPANLDPEEAFVASIASCHMLTFLWLASRAGFQADTYDDEALGQMTTNAAGIPWVSTVTLRPRVVWSGARQPSVTEIEDLHHQAHEQCYISNSVKTRVIVETKDGA